MWRNISNEEERFSCCQKKRAQITSDSHKASGTTQHSSTQHSSTTESTVDDSYFPQWFIFCFFLFFFFSCNQAPLLRYLFVVIIQTFIATKRTVLRIHLNMWIKEKKKKKKKQSTFVVIQHLVKRFCFFLSRSFLLHCHRFVVFFWVAYLLSYPQCTDSQK